MRERWILDAAPCSTQGVQIGRWMIDKHAQTSLTKTGILITLLTFYAVLFVLIGYAYGNTNIIQNQQISAYSALGSSTFGFLGAIFNGISNIPWWLNTIIFTPLVVGLLWIIISSLPTFNGGG